MTQILFSGSMPNLSHRDALALRLESVLKESAAVSFLKNSRALWEKAWTGGRPLSPEEIQGLRGRGNESGDWAGLRVLGDGSLENVSQSRFEGRVVIRLGAEPTRIWKSRLAETYVGAGCEVENVGRAANVWLENNASLRTVGEITGGAGRFCLGLAVHPGSETGSRRVWLVDGLGLDDCAAMANLIPADQEILARKLDAMLAGLESPFTFVGPSAVVELTRMVADAYVGSGAVIRGATVVKRCILAPAETPVRIGAAAILEDAVLQPGARVRSGGIALRSLLLENSTVEKAGQVSDSILGPNTHVAKGEVTASLVGPFVGFHHQALLIGALWPEGRGNVAYGANVGSNHTGRKPDQEIRPGEGAFFGLGCSIKFPANFSEAPFSLFATGVVTLPQRLGFPFSLLSAPAGNRPENTEGLNEITPGWMWGENAYALIRNAYKFQDRDQTKAHAAESAPENSPVKTTFLEARLFAPPVATLAAKALIALRRAQSATPPVFLERYLPALGKNFLRPERVGPAISAYENYLRWILIRNTLWNSEQPASAETEVLAATLKALGLPPQTLESLAQNLIQSVESSLGKDAERGERIFDDYAAFHPEPTQDAVCMRLRGDLESLAGRFPRA